VIFWATVACLVLACICMAGTAYYSIKTELRLRRLRRLDRG